LGQDNSDVTSSWFWAGRVSGSMMLVCTARPA